MFSNNTSVATIIIADFAENVKGLSKKILIEKRNGCKCCLVGSLSHLQPSCNENFSTKKDLCNETQVFLATFLFQLIVYSSQG